MTGILELNIEERWVRVQAGVVKDQLNQFLKPHGLFFADVYKRQVTNRYYHKQMPC